MDGLRRGFDHLEKHLESLAGYGLPVVVAVNQFPNDTAEEIAALRSFAPRTRRRRGRPRGFGKGGEGSLELADTVLSVVNATDAAAAAPKFLYELHAPVEEKIRTVAQRIYGADDVVFTPAAPQADRSHRHPGRRQPAHLHGEDAPLAHRRRLSAGPSTGFNITVREVRLSAGAGYIVPLTVRS